MCTYPKPVLSGPKIAFPRQHRAGPLIATLPPAIGAGIQLLVSGNRCQSQCALGHLPAHLTGKFVKATLRNSKFLKVAFTNFGPPRHRSAPLERRCRRGWVS